MTRFWARPAARFASGASLLLSLSLGACGNDSTNNPGTGGGVSNGGSAPQGGSTQQGGSPQQGGSSGSLGGSGAAQGGASSAGAGGEATAGSSASGGTAGSSGGLGGVGTSGAAGMAAGGAGGAGLAGSGGNLANGGSGGAAGAAGQGTKLAGLPKATDVLASMRSANDHFAAKWPDPTIDIITDKARPSNLWTRAVYYEGLMGLHSVDTDAARKTSYYNYAVRWGESPAHPWQLTHGDATSTSGDDQACGQTYIDLYIMDRQAVRIADIRSSIDRMITERITNVWTWIDAIQMAMPVFAKFGVLFNDTKYYDHMWLLYADSRDTQGGGLFNEQAGLWWRDANFNPGGTYTRSPNNQDIYWSRGNGWVFAALVRVLDIIPANETHRAQYEADFRAMAAALVPLQRSDGFWHESLINPTHCESVGKPGEDGPETTGTSMFAYGLAWGIRRGLLDSATYGPVLVKAWNGLIQTALQSNGFLGWVQSTGAAPCDNTPKLGATVVPNFEDYGVGCFLLAGSEVIKLTQ